MIEKHISELLKTSDRVIIPDFGAFLKSKGEVKNIIFNEFIKFNDGQLTQFVYEKEGIGIEEASKKINEFIAKIKLTLDRGSKFPIENVGVLYKDDKERLRFESSDAKTAKAPIREIPKIKDSITKPKIEPVVKREIPKIEKPVVEPPKAEIPKPEPPKPEPPKGEPPKPEPKFPTPVIEYGKTPPKEAPKPEEQKKEEPKKEEAKPKPPVKDENKKEKIRQQYPRKVKAANTGEDEKSKYLGAWITIAVIVVAIVVWLILDWKNVPGYFDSLQGKDKQEQVNQTPEKKQVAEKKTQQKTEAEKPASETNTDEQKTPPEKEEEKPVQKSEETKTKTEQTPTPVKKTEQKTSKSKQTVSGPAKRYHLIAGVFSEEGNADKKLSELKSDGYYPQKLQNNKLYYVKYNSFEKKKDAQYELKRLYDNGIEVWLYYY